MKLAVYYGLATEKDPNDLPTKPEKSEFILMRVIHRCAKPIALFVDDAHDLHSQTLLAVKRFGGLMRQRGVHLAVVLAGHPKLKNDLRRPVIEEIGSRSTDIHGQDAHTAVLELEGIKGQQQRYITWLLGQCTKPKMKLTDLLTEQALMLLAERLATPLQIEQHLALALEAAYHIGVKPVTSSVVESILSRHIGDWEAVLTRNGYDLKALAALLAVKPREIKLLLQGQLDPVRAQELQEQMLAAGLPIA